MRASLRFVILCGFIVIAASVLLAGGIEPEHLQCEHLANPVGIDAPQPRLSWTLRAAPADQRGQAQTAYQILVAGSEQLLGEGRGDLWDSGKAASNRCAEIAYAGKPLHSYQDCYWKVRVWGKDGEASEWTSPARWSMGVLDPGEWRGKWLGYSKAGQTLPEAAANAAEEKPWAQKFPSPLFRKVFEVQKPLVRATACICGLGYYELRLNGKKVGDRVLDPKFTRYDKRALYAVYDVTEQLARARTRSAQCSATDFTTSTPRRVEVRTIALEGRAGAPLPPPARLRRRHERNDCQQRHVAGSDRAAGTRRRPQRRGIRRPARNARLGHRRVRRFGLGRAANRRRAERGPPRRNVPAHPRHANDCPGRRERSQTGRVRLRLGAELRRLGAIEGLRPRRRNRHHALRRARAGGRQPGPR